MSTDHSPLLARYIGQLADAAERGAILDLACGNGRNGLYLIEHDIPVVFADNDPAALAQVERALATERYSTGKHHATLWPVDFEQNFAPGGARQTAGGNFGGVIVFRYLHRSLFDYIKEAVYPGGLVIYETFTVDQPQYGRPNNPDYLLEHGELAGYFADWNILHSFEGVVEDKVGENAQAIAQIVALKER